MTRINIAHDKSQTLMQEQHEDICQNHYSVHSMGVFFQHSLIKNIWFSRFRFPFSIRYSITAVDDGIMLRNCRRRTAGSAFLHVNNSSLPFAAAVGSTNRTRNGWSVEVAQELRVRHAHLKGQVLTQLKAIVTERRKRRGNKQYSEFQHLPIKNNNTVFNPCIHRGVVLLFFSLFLLMHPFK